MIMTLAIAISSFAAFAREGNVSTTVLDAFTTEFAEAKDVQWTSGSNFYKADFIMNSQYMAAYYNFNGQLLGVTRNISSLDLPLNLQNNLRKDYGSHWISGLFEVSNDDGTHYYITMENADEVVTLKSSNNGKWKVYKKAVKS